MRDLLAASADALGSGQRFRRRSAWGKQIFRRRQAVTFAHGLCQFFRLRRDRSIGHEQDLARAVRQRIEAVLLAPFVHHDGAAGQTGVRHLQPELGVLRHDVVILPQQVLAPGGQQLRVDGVLSRQQARRQDVLCVDDLRLGRRGSVAVLDDAQDFRRHAEVGVHAVTQILAALREVHLALAVHQLVDGDVAGDDPHLVRVADAAVLIVPGRLEAVVFILRDAGGRHKDRRRGVVPEELLRPLRHVLVCLDLIGHRLGVAQAAAVGVQRIQLPHQKHVFDGDGHLQTVAAADYVVGEVQPRDVGHPVRRDRPQLDGVARCVAFDDGCSLALDHQVGLVDLPQCAARHKRQRIRARHEVQEGVVRDLVLVAVGCYPEQLAGDIRQIGGDLRHRRQPRTAGIGRQELLRVPVRRRRHAGREELLHPVRPPADGSLERF